MAKQNIIEIRQCKAIYIFFHFLIKFFSEKLGCYLKLSMPFNGLSNFVQIVYLKIVVIYEYSFHLLMYISFQNQMESL